MRKGIEQTTPGLIYVFGCFELIPDAQVLLREGRPVKLGGRALDILQLLVSRPGSEISKKELMDFAWPDSHVDEPNLKVHIRSLRRALGDTFPRPTFIATIVGHGYQFVAPVTHDKRHEPWVKDKSPQTVGGLPSAPPLVGRDREIELLRKALNRSSVVTLTGTGGVGKTSLAVATAHVISEQFQDGVYFVDFTTIGESSLVTHLVLTSLGVRSDQNDPLAALSKSLRAKRSLIVLDNCEHVIHAVTATAASILDSGTDSRLLITSREPLGLRKESVHWIAPLTAPEPHAIVGVGHALSYSAIELFALRSGETAGYVLTEADLSAVAGICSAVDGLPLAIEIAAPLMATYPPQRVLESIYEYCGSSPKNGNPGLPIRHASLWAVLKWSYALLSEEEATVFRFSSVFVGAFEAADLAGLALSHGYNAFQWTMALNGLVTKSLLVAESDGPSLLYRSLQTTRAFAISCLEAEGSAQWAYREHAEAVLRTYQNAERDWEWMDPHAWRNRYERWSGDLRSALDWCFSDGGDKVLGTNLAVLGIRFWNEQSSNSEQLFQVERALFQPTTIGSDPAQLAHLASSRAWSMTLALQLSHETDVAWRTAVDFGSSSGDTGRHLAALYGYAVFLTYTGCYRDALDVLQQLQTIATAVGDRGSATDGERLSTLAEFHLGDIAKVRSKLEALASALTSGMPPSRIVRYREQRYVSIYTTLALSVWLMGEPERALTMVDEMISRTEQVGQTMGQSNILALVALPLALFSDQVTRLREHLKILARNLSRERVGIWRPVLRFYESACNYREGDINGIEGMRSATNELMAANLLVRLPYYRGILAEALLEQGRLNEASDAIADALTLEERVDERWCLPELLRIRARIFLKEEGSRKAYSLLRKAQREAHRSGSQSLELRVLNDWLESAETSDKKDEAHQLLLHTFGGFRDPLATGDLKRSAALLKRYESNSSRT